MEVVIGGVILLFGIIFGSFYNVLIYRLPRDLSISKGRSVCTSCGEQLKTFDLIPLFSQLFLGNKCRYCKAKISIRYPVVELITGLLFLLSYILYGFSVEFAMMVSLWSLLLITTIIDFEHMVILDSVLIVFAVLGAIGTVVSGTYLDSLWGALLGFGCYLAIYLLAKLIYKREAFGFGDVLFIGVIGIYLGFQRTLVTIMLSFIVAAVGILVMRGLGKKLAKREEVPFGPFIGIAAFIVSIFGEIILAAYLGMFNFR